jgi:uncharacterized integral membrane protein
MPDEKDDRRALPQGHEGSGRDVRTIARLAVWGVLCFVLLMLVLQNGNQTDVRFLGWTISMPLFALILGMAVIGGVIVGVWMLVRGRGRGSGS